MKSKRIRDFTALFEAVEDIWLEIITGRHAIKSKKSFGSTNPKLIAQAIKREERWLKRKV